MREDSPYAEARSPERNAGVAATLDAIEQTGPERILPRASLDDLESRGFTRRGLLRVAGLVAAGASLPFASEPALAQLSALGGRISADDVKINANEFPVGPSPAAIEALMAVARRGNRYQYPETWAMLETLARLESLPKERFVAYPGSSLALHHAVIAFTSPGRGLVTVDPGYEAAARAAEFIGAPVERVPLRTDGAHDVKAMVAAAKKAKAGLLYVCSPNNPTGTITKRADVRWLIENKPADCVVLLDEAYIHFCDEPGGGDLVRTDEDVVVIRTFSKIYGMAGLRAGYAMAREDLLERMKGYKAGAMPATAMAAANAMLKESTLVPERKRGNTRRREDLMRFLEAHDFGYTPSKSSKLMVETGMPTQDVIDGMAAQGVFIGRPWPVWPTHVRVSIGSESDMKRFQAVFLEVTRG